MEKLTIEQLAPYLPYRLKGRLMGYLDDLIIEMNGIEKDFRSPFIWITEGEDENKRLIQDFIPILRPLSDLIQPIFDGVAPLTIICHEYFGFGKGYISAPEFDLINENGFIGFQIHNQGVYFVREETNYGISTYFTHQLKSENIWIPQKVTQQLEMFQYLFENHFDVFGLIDAGLAIDINTI